MYGSTAPIITWLNLNYTYPVKYTWNAYVQYVYFIGSILYQILSTQGEKSNYDFFVEGSIFF